MSFSDDVISDCLTIRQSKTGYRFGLDALLLATDLPPFERINRHVIEFGPAHGPVCLSIASRLADLSVVGVEVQDDLLMLLQHNIEHNHFGSSVVEAMLGNVKQIKTLLPSHQASLVLFNPPYFPLKKRRVAPNPQRAIARHEVEGTLHDFIMAAQYVLHPKGWCKFVIPPWRLMDAMSSWTQTDFGCVSIRTIHANPQTEAYLLEVVLRRGARTDMMMPPALYIRDKDGFYTDEVCQRLAHAACAEPHPDAMSRIHSRSQAN